MNEIGSIGQSHPALARIAARRATEAQNAGTPDRGTDSVELSRTAQLLAKLHALPDVRQDLVDRVRAEIQAGTYETQERLEAALEGLMDDLDLP